MAKSHDALTIVVFSLLVGVGAHVTKLQASSRKITLSNSIYDKFQYNIIVNKSFFLVFEHHHHKIKGPIFTTYIAYVFFLRNIYCGVS